MTSLMRLIIFVLGAMVSIALGVFFAAHGPAWAGLSTPFILMAFASAVIAFLIFALSAFLLRREGASIAVLGLSASWRHTRDLVVGFSISSILFLGVACCQAAMVGASWYFQGWSGASAAALALALTGCMVFAEELIFRGVGFRYLRAAVGDRAAIMLSAVAFGGYHLIGSHNWGMGLAFQFLAPAAGGLVFGWAAIRSGGLALPMGLHWGGNWVQAGIAGFSSVTDLSLPQTLWRIPVTTADLRLLMAPDLLPHLPYFTAMILSVALLSTSLRARTSGRTVLF